MLYYCILIMMYFAVEIMDIYTAVPVMNGHPRDQAKVSVHDR